MAGVEEDRVWLGVPAETKEVGRCGRVTVEANGQSPRSPVVGLEECAWAGVDKPDIKETDTHDRRVKPAVPTTVQAVTTSCRRAAVSCRRWHHHAGGGGRWAAVAVVGGR
jgi:hypothetical protein